MRRNLTIAVDDDNDIYLVNGDIALCDGLKAQEQIVAAAIKTRMGELQFNVNKGIPYFTTIFNSSNKHYLDLWEAAVKKRVSEFDFISAIQSFEYDLNHDTSRLTYRLVAKTTNDQILTVTE